MKWKIKWNEPQKRTAITTTKTNTRDGHTKLRYRIYTWYTYINCEHWLTHIRITMLYFSSNLKCLSLKCIAHSIYLPFGLCARPPARLYALLPRLFAQTHCIAFCSCSHSATSLIIYTQCVPVVILCFFSFLYLFSLSSAMLLLFWINEMSTIFALFGHGVYYRFLLIRSYYGCWAKRKKTLTHTRLKWYKQPCL